MAESSPQKTLVMKFGGTSVGSAEAMTQVIEIVRQGQQDWTRLVVVASALNGVTNLLLDSANRSALGDREAYRPAVEELTARHFTIIEHLVTDPARGALLREEIGQMIADFASRCQAISVLNEVTPRAMDAIAGLGEQMCVRVLAAALNSAGIPATAIDATQLIVTDDCFQSAHPDLEVTTMRTRQKLGLILSRGEGRGGHRLYRGDAGWYSTTLGRGGSDYSGALLGAVLPADEVWIWTDVDGVMTADPRLVPDARTIPVLSYREVSELAYFGAKVLHPKTIRPVIEAGIGLRVCNTFNPEHPGTRLVAELPAPATG